MPRAELTPENRVVSVYEYPKLFLDKGERARILVIEKAPLFEYVHTLRSPKVIGGRVLTETVENFGQQTEQPQYNFISRPICLGDLNMLADKGTDPEGCPACAVAVNSDAIAPPQRRFAMHIVWYATKPGVFDVQDPFNAKLVAWTFTNQIFNKLVGFQEEWGDLREHDLLLGPCEIKTFQKFDIQAAARAEWLTSPERTAFVKALYSENQAQDLAALIGRKVSRETMTDDVRKVEHAHHLAFGRASAGLEDEGRLVGTEALDDLLDGDSGTSEGGDTALTAEVEAILASTETLQTPEEEVEPPKKKRATKAKAEVAEPAPEPGNEADEEPDAPANVPNLEDILADLG